MKKYLTVFSSVAEQNIVPGDYIVEIDGRSVHGTEFQNAAIEKPGSYVTLKVRRNGLDREVQVERRDMRMFSNLSGDYQKFTPAGVQN